MTPLPSPGLLATRFLEPLARPWAFLGVGVAGGGVLGVEAMAHGARLALRLLALLLSF